MTIRRVKSWGICDRICQQRCCACYARALVVHLELMSINRHPLTECGRLVPGLPEGKAGGAEHACLNEQGQSQFCGM